MHLTEYASSDGLGLAKLIKQGDVSKREVIDAAANVTNRVVPVAEGGRRPGDCTKLVSGSERASRDLGWQPSRSDMKTMIADAWRWHQSGYYDR